MNTPRRTRDCLGIISATDKQSPNYSAIACWCVLQGTNDACSIHARFVPDSYVIPAAIPSTLSIDSLASLSNRKLLARWTKAQKMSASGMPLTFDWIHLCDLRHDSTMPLTFDLIPSCPWPLTWIHLCVTFDLVPPYPWPLTSHFMANHVTIIGLYFTQRGVFTGWITEVLHVYYV